MNQPDGRVVVAHRAGGRLAESARARLARVTWLLAGCLAAAEVAGGIYVEARKLVFEPASAPRILDARPRPAESLPSRTTEEAVSFASRA